MNGDLAGRASRAQGPGGQWRAVPFLCGGLQGGGGKNVFKAYFKKREALLCCSLRVAQLESRFEK